MRSYTYAAHFFGGAFLVALSRFVNGVSGRPFPSPFASPTRRGMSSPMANVLWGAPSCLAPYFLIARVGRFEVRRLQHALPVAPVGLLMAVMLARAFGRVLGGS